MTRSVVNKTRYVTARIPAGRACILKLASIDASHSLEKALKTAEKRLSCTLNSTLWNVERLVEIITALAERCDFSEEDRNKIDLAVREAAVNAVIHGNKDDPSKKIEASIDVTEEAMSISITDQGRGFDPGAVPDPLASDNLLKQSGRGIFLMRRLVDDVVFRVLESGTEVILTKRRTARDSHRCSRSVTKP